MIELKHINLSFKDHWLLKNQNIMIYDHHITVITGESGCGKSTLLYEIVQYTHYGTYDYYVDGRLMNDKANKIDHRNIGFVFQDCHLFDTLSVIQNIRLYTMFGYDHFSEKKVMELLDEFNLNVDLNESVKVLSGGQKQRLLILCCMMKNPDIICLDEPTAYLDKTNSQEILEILSLLSNKYHKTIVIASHDQDVLKIANIHYHIQNKEIILMNSNLKQRSITQTKTKTENDPISFYRHAMKKNKIHFKRNIFLIFIMALVSYMTCFQNYYNKVLSQTINQMIYNEIRISYDPGGNSYSVTGKEIPQTLINELSNHHLISSISPFYEWNVKLEHLATDTEVVIQPYRSYQKMKGKANNGKPHLIINDQIFVEDILISSSLYELIHTTNIKGKMEICKNNQLDFSELSFELVDVQVLDEDIKNSYTHSTENIIYLPERLCQKIIHYFINDFTYHSNVYLLKLYSYLDFKDVSRFIKQKDEDIKIYNSISDSVINETSSFSQEMILKFARYMLLIFVFTCILLSLFDIIHSRFEYALLMINGLTKRNCIFLIIKSQLRLIIFSNIFSELFLMIMFYIQYSLVSIDLAKNSLFLLFIFDCLLMAIPCLSFMITFFKKNPGEILKS